MKWTPKQLMAEAERQGWQTQKDFYGNAIYENPKWPEFALMIPHESYDVNDDTYLNCATRVLGLLIDKPSDEEILRVMKRYRDQEITHGCHYGEPMRRQCEECGRSGVVNQPISHDSECVIGVAERFIAWHKERAN